MPMVSGGKSMSAGVRSGRRRSQPLTTRIGLGTTSREVPRYSWWLLHRALGRTMGGMIRYRRPLAFLLTMTLVALAYYEQFLGLIQSVGAPSSHLAPAHRLVEPIVTLVLVGKLMLVL